MARTFREPSFLPLTLSTAGSVAATPADGTHGRRVHGSAMRADSAAAECWAALLGGCDAPGRHVLPSRLQELALATSVYAGTLWWFGDGSRHRLRIGSAQARIEEAVAERDGEDFAEAFVGYDQAVATALVRVHNRSGSPAR